MADETYNNPRLIEIPEKTPEAEKIIKEIFNNSNDVELQSFKTKHGNALVAYIDGMSNKDLVNRDIIYPLKSQYFNGNIHSTIKAIYFEVEKLSQVIDEILKGNTAILYDNLKKALIVDFKYFEVRGVETPEAEAVIRGPKEGFNENFRTNTALIRRKVKTPDLIFENYYLGRQSKTAVALVYIKGIVNREVLKRLRKKINEINIDHILDVGQIEQLIDKNKFSPISGIGMTQKPDIVANKIIEGRIAILCDGTPHVLLIPELFVENLHNADDNYNRVVLTNILRMLRLFGLFISVLLPGLSIAVFTFDQEMIPSVFLNTLIASTEKTPLPTGAEIFFLILMFELLRESGTRLPRTVGNAISIVGALIIGEAAVSAGIVSAPAVIIVALMAVTSFILPNLMEFVIIYRFLFLILGGFIGLIGIASGLMLMLIQLCSIESFGVPILSFFSKEDLKNSFIIFPLKKLKYRPQAIAKDNVKRIDME